MPTRLALVFGALAVWATSLGTAMFATSDPMRRVGIEVIGLLAAVVGIVVLRDRQTPIR